MQDIPRSSYWVVKTGLERVLAKSIRKIMSWAYPISHNNKSGSRLLVLYKQEIGYKLP